MRQALLIFHPPACMRVMLQARCQRQQTPANRHDFSRHPRSWKSWPFPSPPTPETSAVEVGSAKIVTHDFDCFDTVCKRAVRVLWYLPAPTATAQTLPLVVSRTPWANRDRATRAFVCVLSHLT